MIKKLSKTVKSLTPLQILFSVLVAFSALMLIIGLYKFVYKLYIPIIFKGYFDPLSVSSDFGQFYDAAIKYYLERNSPYDAKGFLYPPLSLLVFYPFQYLSEGVSYLSFSLINLAASVCCIFMALNEAQIEGGRKLEKLKYMIVFMIAISYWPVISNAILGQITALIILLCFMFYRSSIKNQPIQAGLFLAIGIWIKIYPVVFCLFILDERFRRSVLWTLVWCIALPLICLPVIPVDLHLFYFVKLLPRLTAEGPISLLNQSAISFLSRFVEHEIFWFDFGYKFLTSIRLVNYAILMSCLCLVFFNALKNNKQFNFSVFAWLLAVIPIVSPLAWEQVYQFSVPLYILGLTGKSKLMNVITYLCSFILLVPISKQIHLLDDGALFPIANLFYSRYFLANILMLSVSYFTVIRRDNVDRSVLAQNQ